MFKIYAFGALLAAGASSQAAITTLSAKINVDNVFSAYLSSSATLLGTQFLSGNAWSTTYTGSININTGGIYWLHVRAVDQGLPAMFLGEFSLSGFQATFNSTGTASLLSHIDNFVASTGANPGAAAAFDYDEGPNGTSPWGNMGSISASARYIWARNGAGGDLTGDANPAFFSTQLTVVPEPASMTILGLAVAGMASRKLRKSRKL